MHTLARRLELQMMALPRCHAELQTLHSFLQTL